jgi:hypothetical protein
METTTSRKSVPVLPCNIVYPSQEGKFPQQQPTESATANCLQDFGQYEWWTYAFVLKNNNTYLPSLKEESV